MHFAGRRDPTRRLDFLDYLRQEFPSYNEIELRGARNLIRLAFSTMRVSHLNTVDK